MSENLRGGFFFDSHCISVSLVGIMACIALTTSSTSTCLLMHCLTVADVYW